MAIIDFPTSMESLVFWTNNINIATAKLIATGSGDQVLYSLGLADTIDGAYTWEEVSSGNLHTFTATGKFIKWRVVGNNFVITKIEVVINP